MPDIEFKRLSRRELLEMLIEQGYENERLRAELDEANRKLADRDLKIQNSGTLAEATFALNGVYTAVDAAAKQYLHNIKRYSEEKQEEYERIIAKAEKKAERIIKQAEQKKERILGEIGGN